MDREIPISEIRKKRRKLIIKLSVVGLIILSAIIILLWSFESSVSEKDLIIGTVDRGPIEITVSASGKLTPLVEEIVISPINTRILEVYKNPGDIVEEGEPLLKLELTSVETEYKQKLDEMQMMKSKMVQVQVTLDNTISGLRMEQQVKDMQLKQLYTDLQSEKYLDKIGASTQDKIRRIELNYEEAKLQLQQLEQKIENEKKNAEAELQVKKLEISIFEKTLNESERLLKDARILSPKKATLTFINNQIGAQVAQGAQLAIISDLTRFKVDAEVADSHRDKLSAGAKAIIKIGNIELKGTVINITPSVTNGVINFIVVPDESNHSGLRSGLKTEVYVLYGLKENVMRLPNGSWFSYGAGDYSLWVMKDGKAEKRKVKLGESSFEYVEVVSGLQEGDRVILSDMDNYKYKESITIN